MLPDEHGDVHLPPPSTAPVIVRPKLPSQSRTIREAWRWRIGSVIVAAVPDILSVLFYLLTSDKDFYAFVSKWLPAPIRYAAMTAFITYTQRVIIQRKRTAVPIAGTEAAKEMMPAYNAKL